MEPKSKVDRLLFGERKASQSFVTYDSSYLFTTENISGYMPQMQDKKVLTVAASGDHYFNALLNGARDISLFDINKLTMYVLKLKKKAIELLSFDEFLLFMGLSKYEWILDYGIYCKIRDYLEKDVREYWDYVYSKLDYNGFKLYHRTNLFNIWRLDLERLRLLSEYLYEDKYIELKSILKEINDKDIKFYHANALELPRVLDSNYDYMYFSNINDYVNGQTRYLKTMKKLKERNLSVGGIIYFAYLYDFNHNPKSIMYKELKDNPEIDFISVPGFDNIYNRLKDSGNDRVYRLKKKI